MAAVTVILADGFDGQDVLLTVDGKERLVAGATTRLLTGHAETVEFQVAATPATSVTVTAQLVGDAGLAGARVEAAALPGQTVLVNLAGDDLTADTLDGPVGFASGQAKPNSGVRRQVRLGRPRPRPPERRPARWR
jgi:hypothetical protein